MSKKIKKETIDGFGVCKGSKSFNEEAHEELYK